MAMKLELGALLLALLALPYAAAGCRQAAAGPVVSRAISEHFENDRRGDAEWCGALRPGRLSTIRGHVSAAGSDTFDGFAFASTSACTVRYRLRPTLPGADLDLCAVDVASGRVRAVADGEEDEERGTIRIEREGVALELVVSSAWGSSGYVLEIETVDLEPARAPAAPCARKDTIEKLEAYLRRGAESEPADSARVPVRLASLAESDPAGRAPPPTVPH